MTPAPQQYIISEERLKRFENGGYFDVLLKEIRSRPAPAPETFEQKEDRELNIRIAGFEEGYAQGKAEAAAPAPEHIHPRKDCFGKYQGVGDDKCFSCNDWGYCADVTEAAAQAREDVLEYLATNYKGRYVEDAVAEIRQFGMKQHEAHP